VPDAALDEVRRHGFALIEGFLAPDELHAAQEALWLHFPSAEEYFRDPDLHADLAASQFAGVREFPYKSWELNRLAFHPDLVDAAERYLGTPELHPYKVELWAKYAGAVDYDQPPPPRLREPQPGGPPPGRPLPAVDDLRLPVRRHGRGRPHPDRPL
jgi:hypothetical protein